MGQAAKFVRHEGCNNCGSRDNVGVWSDGSKWCFGCHWWSAPSFGDKVQAVERFRDWSAKHTPSGETIVELPADYNTYIPPEPYNWIRQYLNHAEVNKNFGYSMQEQRLIFPYYSANKLRFWTGRYFGADPTAPKYWTEGERNENIILFTNQVLNRRIVFVEDVVSAIKVGRVASACPIFGSNVPSDYVRSLAKGFSQAVLWLDHDKRKEAMKQAIYLNTFFKDGVKVVFTEKDPKAYAEIEIASRLGRENAD